MNQRGALMSTFAGGKTVIYIIIIIIFAMFMAVAMILVLAGQNLEAKVPENFKDTIDWTGLKASCGMLDWDNLEKINTCVTPSAKARAYQITFTVNDEKRAVQTLNWKDNEPAPRVSPRFKEYIFKDGELVEAGVIWEAQHASFLN